MGRCRFNSSWLSSEDGQGHLLSEWGAASSDNLAVICKICDALSSINIQKAGFQALKQNANTAAHKANVHVKLNPAQLRLSKGPATSTATKTTTDEGSGAQAETIRLYSVRDATTTSELIWCMLGVANNWSFASNQHVPDCFRVSFHPLFFLSFFLYFLSVFFLNLKFLGLFTVFFRNLDLSFPDLSQLL